MPGSESEEEYEVQEIVDSRIRRGKRYYRIRWKGFGAKDDTWEPVTNLEHCIQLVEDFDRRNVRSSSTPVRVAKEQNETNAAEESLNSLPLIRKSKNEILSAGRFKETYGRYPDIDEIKENARLRSIAKVQGDKTPELKIKDNDTVVKNRWKKAWFFALYLGVAIIAISILLYIMDFMQLFSSQATS